MDFRERMEPHRSLGPFEFVRQLLNVPESHEALLLPFGREKFLLELPRALAGRRGVADYILTGPLSEQALRAAETQSLSRYCYDGKLDGAYVGIPEDDELSTSKAACYLHYTAEDPAVGSQFHQVPKAGVPVVADMTGEILSRPPELEQIDLAYAELVAGWTLAVGRGGLLRQSLTKCFRPAPDDTENCELTAYLRAQVEEGGPEEMERRNASKAALLYTTIDYSENFYHCPIPLESRSLQSCAFCLPSAKLEVQFLARAAELGLDNYIHRAYGDEWLVFRMGEPTPIELAEKFSDVLEEFRALS